MSTIEQITQRIDNVTQQAIEQQKIVGSVVMVAKQGEIIYQQAAGFANREQHQAMTLNSIFLLSSVTKPIVIAAALCLIAQGKLNLNDTVTQYLPNFKPKLADGRLVEITIHQLLTHSSGLSYRFAEAYGNGDYNRLLVSDGFDEIVVNIDENLQRLSQAPLLFEPGKGWSYSLSIDVLAAIMSIATNQSLPDLILSIITQPLAMSSTGFTVKDTERLVTHYYNETPDSETKPIVNNSKIKLPPEWNNGILSFDPKRIFNPNAYPSGGAGMAGSAPDFMQFLLALTTQSSSALPNHLMAKMNQLYIGSDNQTQGPGWGFGYGGAVLDDPKLANSPQGKGTIQWGGVYGHNWFYDPINQLAVVNFTNTSPEGLFGLYPTQITNAIYGA